MSKPFAKLLAERSRNPEAVVREAASRMLRWSNLSSSAQVSLDEVAWLGAVMYLAGIQAAIDGSAEPDASVSREGNVVTVVAGDSPGRIKDGVARQ